MNAAASSAPRVMAASLGLGEQLAAGLAELKLELSASASGKLLDYLDLLQRWNRTYNLTAIRAPHNMLTQHVLDSLAVMPVLAKSALAGRHMDERLRVADVGSGAGLPGIPLAIACPHWAVTLVEAVDKKTAFQRQVKIDLGLGNLHIIGARVEDMTPGGFDLVISRAFASLSDFVALAGHLVVNGGCLCAMKGVRPDAEIARLPAGWCLDGMEQVIVPGLQAQRNVLFLRKI